MTPKIAVIIFPGTNCELEALRALKRSDMNPELIRWNDETVDYSSFDGFFVPGGFSYEDRGRSGIIASKNPLLKKVKEEAAKGKPVLGVCNGAQILMEAGLIPGLDTKHVEMCLAENKRIDKEGNILGTGFYNDWIYIKNAVTPGRTAFNNFKDDHLMRIPVAHAEGRFTTIDQDLIDLLQKNEQTVFKYSDKNGDTVNEFPVNPNGALLNLAGVCNPEGNVMSLMPHPERTINGQAIFDSMRDYINKTFTVVNPSGVEMTHDTKVQEEILEFDKPSVEILVDTIITDNEERTVEHAIHDMGFNDTKLKKQVYFGIYADGDLKAIAEELIKTGELVNLAKEVPTVVIGDKYFSYDKDDGLQEHADEKTSSGAEYLAVDKENMVGENIYQTLRNHFSVEGIQKIAYGKKWILSAEGNAEDIVKTHIFNNPHATDLYKV